MADHQVNSLERDIFGDSDEESVLSERGDLFPSDDEVEKPLPSFKKSSASKPRTEKKKRERPAQPELEINLSKEDLQRREANLDIDAMLKNIKSSTRVRKLDLQDEVEMDEQAQSMYYLYFNDLFQQYLLTTSSYRRHETSRLQ